MAIDDIALTLVPGLGVKGVVHLLEVFGTAQAIFAASADELAGRAELRPDIARSIAARKSHPEAERECAIAAGTELRPSRRPTTPTPHCCAKFRTTPMSYI